MKKKKGWSTPIIKGQPFVSKYADIFFKPYPMYIMVMMMKSMATLLSNLYNNHKANVDELFTMEKVLFVIGQIEGRVM